MEIVAPFLHRVYTAVGLAVMTRDKIEEIGKNIAADAKLSEI